MESSRVFRQLGKSEEGAGYAAVKRFSAVLMRHTVP
jgi:hypothetical protein